MFILKIENSNSDTLTLTQNESRYQIISVDGLTPPSADIHTAEIAGLDGAKYKSSQLNMRNIVITVALNGDVEANRIDLYRVFKAKQYCKIYYTNGNRKVYAEGYVETIEGSFFSAKEQVQISIICPFPYFKAVAEIAIDISKSQSLFEFPFAIDEEGVEFSSFDENRIVNVVYSGDVESGCIFKLTATGTVVNPSILKVDTGERLTLDMTLDEGDEIEINTNKGGKYVRLIQGTTVSNAVKYLAPESEWLTLDLGINRLFYEAESGEKDLYIEVITNSLFEGV